MNQIDCDLLVIGGGAAGSRAAYEAKRVHSSLRVLMVVAGKFGLSGSTNFIASESLGINAPFNTSKDGDSPDVFYQDILETGAGLSDPIMSRILADEACYRIEELIDIGLRIDKTGGKLRQCKLSGCTKARSLTCGGSTGRGIVRVLKREIRKQGTAVLENTRVIDLLQDDNGRICGALAFRGNRPLVIRASVVLLASGGAGKIFRHNVNPPSLEGDGWAMAYRAGAKLVNMEFFQIGPAIFNAPLQFIIHSHMWRLRPRLTNALGEDFLPRHCPPGVDPTEVLDLKAMSYPFSLRTDAKYLDIAIFKEVMAGRGTPSGAVWFDLSHVDRETLRAKAPITYLTLLKVGIDLATDRIEMGLVVQNFNGGILIDPSGFTGIDGLFAAGEVTGGVHGADRPGGNNLIDTQVFGYRAGRGAAEKAIIAKPSQLPVISLQDFLIEPPGSEEGDIMQRSADLYYNYLTIVRSRDGLQKVLEFNERYGRKADRLLANRLVVGSLFATAALTRQESRGTHYREDFPHKDPLWDKRILLSRSEGEQPLVEITP